MGRTFRRLRSWLRHRQIERDLVEELEMHRAMTQERLEQRGLTPDHAAPASRRTLGNVTLAREDARQIWIAPWLEGVWQDAAYAVRAIRRSPGFAMSVVAVIALGIGATTAVFSLVDGLVLRSLPVHNPDRLVYLRQPSFSYPVLTALRARSADILSSLSAWNLESESIEWGTELEPGEILMASGDFYSTLGIQAAVGRTFAPEDDAIGGGRNGLVAVISHACWQRRFAGNPSVVGRVVRIQRKPFTIIGVTPAGFFGVAPGLAPEITVPLTALVENRTLSSRTNSWLHFIGRLRDGVTRERANVALQTFWPAVLEATTVPDMPADRRAASMSQTASLESAHAGYSRVRNQFAEPLWMLLGLVTLLLIVATASAANLLLARGAARRREFAVRLAIGAGRMRLMRQMLTEAFVWTLLGAGAGLLIAGWSSGALVAMITTWEEPIVLAVAPNWRSVTFTLMLAFLTAACCAIFPALRATRTDAGSTLKEGRGSSEVQGPRGAIGQPLVAAQIALTVLLLFGAALFVRSLARILSQEAGVERDAVLVVSTDAEAAGYDGERHTAFYMTLLERLRQVPGVESASMSRYPPISSDDGAWTQYVGIDGAPVVREPARHVYLNVVTPGYFRTVGIRLLQGRDFGDGDHASSANVVVVTESLARRFFPNESALGRRVGIGQAGSRKDLAIVGVVSDAKYQHMTEQTRSVAFLPAAQMAEAMSGRNPVAEVRVAGSLSTAAEGVRREIRALDGSVPIRIQTVTERIRASLVRERVIAMLASAIALVAVVLACAAVYGLLAYSVARRASEIGLRIALGAERGQMLWMVLRQSLVLGLVGVSIGVGASLALGQFARNLLFEIRENDAVALATAAAVVLAVALCAGFFPARRAAHVEPLIALRSE